jgi:ribonuclease P protein component
MPAAPRAASASASEAANGSAALSRLPASRRLRSPAQFVAVTSDPQAFRSGRRWLAIAGRVQPALAGVAPVRFGFTAARRHARRALDRNAVKRVLREAARSSIAGLDAAAAGRSVDVVLRLKATAPAPEQTGREAWKAALRAEADELLAELARRLQRSPLP